MEGILTEEELGRVALSCRFAPDLLCDESEQHLFEVTLTRARQGVLSLRAA